MESVICPYLWGENSVKFSGYKMGGEELCELKRVDYYYNKTD